VSAHPLPQSSRIEPAQEIFDWLEEKPSLSRTVAAVRRLDALHESDPRLFTSRRAVFVRNFTIEPIEPLLQVAAYRAGIHLEVSYSGYEPANEHPEQWSSEPADVFFVALRLEELAPALTRDFLDLEAGGPQPMFEGVLDHLGGLMARIRAASEAAVIVHNFALPLAPAAGLADSQDPWGQVSIVRRLNLELVELVSNLGGAYLLDVDHLFSRLGHENARDERGARVSDSPLSQAALRLLAESEVRHLRAISGPAIKCLVVDCDNTLWGGVVGEDGVDGLTLGPTGAGHRYYELQRRLLDLRRRGLVLAISSKNEEQDVLAVLRTHPDCLLSETDFAAMRVSWDEKASSIEGIAEELNLGLAHIAFIDDNPVECDWVRTRLPEVKVLQWPDDFGSGGPDDLGLFDSLALSGEDRTRTEMYRAEAGRRAQRQQVSSIEDYLRSLQIVATLGLARAEQLPRLSQLTAKTNQFNLTTRRHDLATLKSFTADPQSRLIWMELSDRFGSSGVVGCGAVLVNGDVATIDTLLLSCRVIGRSAENLMVRRLAELATEIGAGTLIGEYIPSARNAQVADFYERLGFTGLPADEEVQRWTWDLSAGLPPVPDWFEVIDPDS
jgi:FkbH-like protein